MALKRVIPCLDVDAGRVVKGTNFVGLRDAGDPVELAERYDREGADELVFLDITASHERRDTITELARRTADNVFIPFVIGGGIRSVADAQAVLDAGRRQGLGQLGGARPPGADRRARRRLRRPVRGGRDRRPARRRGLRRLRQRRAHRGRGSRGRRLGARGDRARGGGGAAHEHGPRRHHRRLRPGADPRGRRRGRGPGDRLGRRRRAAPPGRGRHRGRRRGRPRRLDLPLRRALDRRGEGGDARGRDRGPRSGAGRRPRARWCPPPSGWVQTATALPSGFDRDRGDGRRQRRRGERFSIGCGVGRRATTAAPGSRDVRAVQALPDDLARSRCHRTATVGVRRAVRRPPRAWSACRSPPVGDDRDGLDPQVAPSEARPDRDAVAARRARSPAGSRSGRRPRAS